MVSTLNSRRTVFRQIARQSDADWPVYDSTPLYNRASLTALESDVRIVTQTWFRHDDHTSVEQFVCSLPLAYFKFSTHDHYAGPTSYGMVSLFRVFMLKDCYGWDHETALVEYLNRYPVLCDQLGLETVPDQSTLWRSWNKRFTANDLASGGPAGTGRVDR
ncbi:transposase (plasmid) [Natrinema versiforme]|uniref:Transposase n=2 Tax=Natrinema versiforme TaxID=88724 RepID=A0A4P8WNY3_9EURY|nr:transposase [Natrinema versiforme]QCS44922.1 transposase [Natrinema versiforme]